MLHPFEVKINVIPAKLHKEAQRYQNVEGDPPRGVDVLEVLRKLGTDLKNANQNHVSTEETLRRWYRRPRELRLLLFEMAHGWPSVSRSDDPHLTQMKSPANHFLRHMLLTHWYTTWLYPAILIYYKDYRDGELLERIRDKARAARYETPLLKQIKPMLPILPNVMEVANKLVDQGPELKERWHDLALGNTNLGEHLLVPTCLNIFNSGQTNTFYPDLLGDYNIGNRNPDKKGLFQEASNDTFAKIISRYFRNVNQISDNNRFAWYAKDRFGSDKESPGWQNPNLEEQARKKLWNWLVRKNINRFLDEFVDDEGRRNFYLSIVQLIDNLRFFVRYSELNAMRKRLDFKVDKLSPPTIMVKIGRLILFDSCEHGMAGIYIYTPPDPIDWDVKLHTPSGYKQFILARLRNRESLPRCWKYQRHVGDWQQSVRSHIYRCK